MLSVINTHKENNNNKAGGRELWELGPNGCDDFKGEYIYPDSLNCIH